MNVGVYFRHRVRIVLFFVLLGVLPACRGPIELDVPTSIKIDQGFITFDQVGLARDYEIMIEKEQEFDHYAIEPGFDLNHVLEIDQNYVLRIRALGNGIDLYDSDYSEPIDYLHRIDTIDQRRLADERLITWTGRVKPMDDRVDFDQSASGFEVSFYGTSLQAILATDVPDDRTYRPYLSMMIDGQNDPRDAQVFFLHRLKGYYTLQSGLEPGYHKVRLYKRSEAVSSGSSLMGLSTDGFFVEPDSVDRPLFVFYGDSLTTGYGNVDSRALDPYETRTQDGLLTYAALSARMFDADLEVVAVSGIGMSVGFREYTMPEIYDRITPNDDTAWNFSDRIPDLVVVSLGANDNSVLSLLPEDE